MIRAEQLIYKKGGRMILDGISVEIKMGEVLAVLGPNGAGKSTLLKMLSGDLTPDSGSVILGDRPLSTWPARELALVRGVLPQSSELNFPLKVLEVVLLGRSPHHGMNETTEDVDIARSALQRVDLQGFDERHYTTLSGGERQRVHLARVLAQLWKKGPDQLRCYFLDEPTASLDIGHQQGLLQTARSLAKVEGAAVFTVLHDLNQAAVFADRILLLKKGKVFAFGKPAEVLKQEIISEAFGLAVRVLLHPDTHGPVILPQY